MNSLKIVNDVAKTYTVEWDVDSIIDVLTGFINKNCYGSEFELHCTQCAAQDLKNECQALREEAEQETV